MSTDLITIDTSDRFPATADQVMQHVKIIDDIKKKVMKDGTHYGVIPGCGDKPALLKPGAEKLCLAFRLTHEFDVQTEDFPNGHRQYTVNCRLRYRDGTLVGQGIGVCSTMESKYRYRTDDTGQLVPSDYWNSRDQELLGGSDYFPAKRNGKWKICRKIEHDNPADYYNCVTPDTKLLTHDLQWVPAGDIESGDLLIGVEENLTNDYARHLAVGEATVHGRRLDQLFEITFEDGRTVRCNGEHKWLVKKVGLKGTEWVSTQDIHDEIAERDGRPRKWTVMSLCRPWVEDSSQESGYVAGALDADGSLGTSQLTVLFAQQRNIVLTRMEAALTARGYRLGLSTCKTQEALDQCDSKEQVYSLRVRGGFAEQLRLLGTIRPPRLLERWLTRVDVGSRRLEGRGSGAGRPVEIRSVKAIGEGEIVLLGTSCHTYIAEGLVCHNTVAKMAKKRAHVDATLSATAASDIFEQDIDEGLPGTSGMREEQAEPNDAPQASAGPEHATEAQIGLIRNKLKKSGADEQALCEAIGVDSLDFLPFAKVNAALQWAQKGGK